MFDTHQCPAYILGGGKSRRFGSDKARAMLHGEPLIVRIARRLTAEGDQVAAVADVAGKYADLGLRTIADRQRDRGPLAGLEAALGDRLDRAGPGWIMLASCDLADIQPAWLVALQHAMTLQTGTADAGAVAFRSDFWQPFPAAFHTRCLEGVQQCLGGGRASFQRLFSGLAAAASALPLPTDWPDIPQVNTPAELARLRERDGRE